MDVCGGTALAVEKVEPDPWNLSVNTVVGSKIILFDSAGLRVGIFYFGKD